MVQCGVWGFVLLVEVAWREKWRAESFELFKGEMRHVDSLHAFVLSESKHEFFVTAELKPVSVYPS
jgi:hypothetical protein